MSGLNNMPDALSVRMDWMCQWASSLSAPMTPVQRREGLQVVTARLAARRRRRGLALGVSFVGFATAAAAGLILVRSGKHLLGPRGGQGSSGAIAYRIEGGEIGDSGYIRSFDSNGSLLRFAEGTELRLMTGARGRLSSVDERGARLAIEEGEAEVKVTPRPGARWLVDAGPFLITVKGTVFTAAWDGATEQLDIRMKKGLISVSGPFADGVMAVRAGQHLAVNVRRREVLLRQLDRSELGGEETQLDQVDGDGEAGPAAPGEDETSSPASPASTSGDGEDAAPSTGGAGTRGHPGLAPGRWAAALAVGDLDDILRDARRHGWRRSMAHASSEDLAALADAARYRRRNEIAREALMTERLRFPKSERASDAAFLLGRMVESKGDDLGRALEWYDVYLKEAPSGAYSSEALGRKMTATQRLEGAAAARQIADEYIRRFPKGTYAGAARALLSGS
jgi:TolA-binding protein